MAESLPSTSTVCNSSIDTQTVLVDKENEQSPPVLQLRLQQPKNEHKVKWTTDTVDNEFMGKKKSKCCCIYEKPKVFGESDSSSSSDDENDDCTAHCRGHKKKCYRHHPHNRKPGEDPHNENDGTSPQLDNDSTGPSSPVPQV
ncbi:E3 ubiquitin-protein ligase PPP1R11 [Biomphalaria glabrata]|uniref:E3 ubiquitin-protein ligase PPP1R11 n=1 Tax=Biomphalaria glabrata TaxID=6526 RepID=A0A9W3BD18_BIOGL|nr:E3 ubiquitin-protein ligase PPP1R11-like [Biomphalaria glabrata]XP_055897395.1 E3 ubiquitin-protein ligase PPP1R11-like [Biomphalaria glabrata]XP_055897396.1 E3 ubiquitin-protein ligase PPP1R11-like [Biomphalaria glabrata]XP_055897397.1 E3 ubiquitin-protein ligase PPP1R11-like [Biomphalaria glabrata]XP_055897398.1 E3 ubiquitin-protein ligase PPP1R11-like [Biomphalaria glabrata]XP_055897399.1 E3 ubiquitin-protein ligase PPP1R11-like [Biomphalaria glabrata]KAI8748825.1 E3 ubiquitin-protein l